MAQVSIWVLRTFHVASRKLMKHPWTWRFCSASASRTEWKNCENTRKASISAQLWWWYFRSGSLSLFGAIRKIALLHVASEQLLPQMFHWACPQGAPWENWEIVSSFAGKSFEWEQFSLTINDFPPTRHLQLDNPPKWNPKVGAKVNTSHIKTSFRLANFSGQQTFHITRKPTFFNPHLASIYPLHWVKGPLSFWKEWVTF